jgi:protein TonB
LFRVGRYAGLFTASTVFHAGVAVVVSIVEPPAVVETVRFRLTEPPPAPPQEAEPPPPPPTPPPVAPAPVRTPQRRAETPPPAPVEAPAAPAPSFGVRMQGGVGQGGVALPAGDSLATPPVTRTAQARALEAPAEERGDAAAECPEEPTRPRPIDIPQPAYTVEARTAGIEGRVRARISVDETGAVTNVAVIEGLGHGLDEAALAALRTARFEPATRCGRPVADTLTISVRFTL